VRSECTVCRHPKCREIDLEISRGSATLTNIAARYGLSRHALRRHRDNWHSFRAPAPAAEAIPEDPVTGDPVLNEAGLAKDRALECLRIAEESGDVRAICAALKEVRECIVLLSRMNAGTKEAPGISAAIRKVPAMSDEEVIARARSALARKG
jgi:hypothetical protein